MEPGSQARVRSAAALARGHTRADQPDDALRRHTQPVRDALRHERHVALEQHDAHPSLWRAEHGRQQHLEVQPALHCDVHKHDLLGACDRHDGVERRVARALLLGVEVDRLLGEARGAGYREVVQAADDGVVALAAPPQPPEPYAGVPQPHRRRRGGRCRVGRGRGFRLDDLWIRMPAGRSGGCDAAVQRQAGREPKPAYPRTFDLIIPDVLPGEHTHRCLSEYMCMLSALASDSTDMWNHA